MTVDVEPVGYYAIGTALKDAGININDALVTLAGVLKDTGSMAGSDEGAKDWGSDYDEAASDQVNTVTLVRDAGLNLGNLVQQAAYNHAVANHKAQHGPNSQGPYAVPGPSNAFFTECAAYPPSSVGDSGPGIQNFIELMDAIGIPVPNGNSEHLDSAAAAWDTFAGTVRKEAQSLVTHRSALDNIVSPETDDVRSNLDAVREQCDALADNASAIAQSTRDHASELRKTREQMKKIAEEELKDLVEGLVISAALSFLTAGLAAAAGAAATAAKIKRAADRIKPLIESLKEFLKLRKARGKIKKIADGAKKKLDDLAHKNKKSIDDAPKADVPPAPKRVTIGGPKEFDPNSVRGMSADDLRASIPKNWVRRPSNSGDGEVFVDPANPGRQIRIMPGYRPGTRPDDLTSGPYVVITQNGGKFKLPLQGNPTL